MGYPTPPRANTTVRDRPRRLFGVLHAGAEVGRRLLGQGDRRSVAVIGDAPCLRHRLRAMNNAGYLNKDLLVILNDNKMSICPRVGALAAASTRARLTALVPGVEENSAAS